MLRKHRVLVFALLAICAAAVINMTACRKSKNLSSRIAPSMDVIHLVNDQLHNAGSKHERDSILDANPWVRPRVVDFATQLGFLKKTDVVDKIVFGWGSLEASVQDSTKKYFDGVYPDQLVAIIFINGDKEHPVVVVVICTNGVIVGLKELKKMDWHETPSIVFTVESGWGLNHYVSYRTAIYLAHYFHLRIYHGHMGDKDRYEITDYKKALAMEATTDQDFVDVPVTAGTTFDVDHMTMTLPNGKKVAH